MRPIALACLILLAVSAVGRSEDLGQRPPINTLNNATAHTLQRDEWRIGSIGLFVNLPNPGTIFSLSQLQWLNVEYGLTPRLQIGTTVLENVLEGPNIWGKFN